MKKLFVTMIAEDDSEIRLNGKYAICQRCDGHGTHTNPNIDGNGITADEMQQILRDDPDFLDDYRNGFYDVTCECCKGKGRIVVLDENNNDPEMVKQYKKWKEDIDEMEREAQAEWLAEARMLGEWR